MTEGQEAFKRALVNNLTGRCTCGRIPNKQGKVCCRQCREGFSSHSSLCELRNA